MYKVVSLIWFLLSLLIGFSASAEKLPFKFGKVSMEELTMEKCQFDEEATSMTLSEYGVIDFGYSNDYGWQYHMNVAVRKKIFKITDGDQGNVKIRLYQPVKGSGKERLSALRANSFNLVNGKVNKVKVSGDEYFERRLNDYWIEISFAISNIQEGSVIEYTYKKTSDYLYNLTTWHFQSEIPVARSEIRFTIPQFFNYQVSQVGSSMRPEEHKEFKQETFTYRWQRQGKFGQVEKGTGTMESNSRYRRLTISNIPALKDEPYMNNKSDAIARLQFQLMSTQMPNSVIKQIAGTYAKFNNDLLQSPSFGDRLKNANFFKDAKASISGGTDLEKAQSVYRHISDHFSWNKVNSMTSSKAGKTAYGKAEGSVADINLTLVAALRSMGLNSNPVILSTRGNGTVHPIYPSYEDYNYVIASVMIDKKIYLCDATTKMPFGQLSSKCRNGQGWMVNEQGGQWLNLKANSKYGEIVMMKTEFIEDQVKTHVMHRKSDYSALSAISKIQKSNEDEYKQDLSAGFTEHEFENFKMFEINTGKPVKMEFDLAQDIDDNDIIYIQPIILGTITKNPFQRETRSSVIDFPYQQSFKVISQIVVPEGYTVQLPETANVGLPNKGGSFIFNCSRNENVVSVVSQVRINQTDFTPDEYPALKQFYQIVADKNQEFIVLSKQ